MVQCAKCDFTYEPAAVPGGLCPRCLLLGMHDDAFATVPEDETAPSSAEALADDELAAELPNFDLEEHLGRGGMGVVWKARERVLNRHVAIKLLRNERKDAGFVDRFTREARVLAQLNHPRIVTLYSFGRTRSNHCYLVMEMVDGKNLGELITQKALDVPTTLAIIQDVCAALRHAHDAGFMHRDIKPGNVLLDTRYHAKVADFGLARLAGGADSTTTITRQGWAVGTPHYIAPEQAHGTGVEDSRADIYSVGVMLYQMLTGELPRGVFRPPSQKQKMDKRLDKIVLRALQEEPDKRYQHVGDLMEDLQKVRENVDPDLLADQQAARHARRWRQRFEIALATAVSVILGFIIAWYVRDWLDTPSSGDASSNSHHPDGGVTLRDASYLPKEDGPAIVREVRLQPPALSSGSLFASSVALSGDWLAVGAPNDASQNAAQRGCVYLYHRGADGNWTLHQCLSNPHASNGRFGYDVALDGPHLVTSSPVDAKGKRPMGSIDLYELPVGASLWRSVSHLGFPLMNTTAPGAKVEMLGNHIVEYDLWGEPGGEKSPRSFALFSRPSGKGPWKPDYTGPAQGFPFLTACALPTASEFVACLADARDSQLFGLGGAPLIDAKGIDENWKAHIVPVSQPTGESDVPPNYRTIAADSDYVIAGNSKWNHLRGIAWALRRDAQGHFVHDAYLHPPPDFGSCEFGKSVALQGAWAAIGADQHVVEDAHRGAVCLYHRDAGEGGTWKQSRLIVADSKGGAMGFGYVVSLSPRFLVVGAPKTGSPRATAAPDDESASGAVFIYEFGAPLP